MPLKSIDNIPITDAKRPLVINITTGDIRRADKKDPAKCVAAVACRRQHHVAEVRIHLGRVYIRQNRGNWSRYVTPGRLRTELVAFDRGGEFEPGPYELRPPTQTRQAMGKRQGSKPKHKQARYNPKRTSRRSPTIVQNVRPPAG